MQIGMIGMGRMGSAMARRLLRAGHRVVAHDVIAQASSAIARDGAVIAGTIADLVAALQPPRIAWMMLPAAVVQGVFEALAALLQSGDVIVDGATASSATTSGAHIR